MATFGRGNHAFGSFENGIPLQDFPGIDPRWRQIVDEDLRTAPWASICAVGIVDHGRVRPAGTGWLAGPTTVITAAHVVTELGGSAGDLGLQVSFPAAAAPVDVTDIHVHELYRGDIDSRFDPFDIAALRIERVEHAPLPIASALPSDATVEVPGYPFLAGGSLVTHEATAVLPDGSGLLLHQADTKDGHSGAPVLLSGGSPVQRAVIALHIHGFKANPFAAQFPAHNVALVIDEEMNAFVRAHLGA